MISLKKSFVYKDLCYLMSLWSVKLPADVLLIAPQVRYLHKIYAKEVKIPYAFIDMSNYGTMNGEAVLDLALDTLNNAKNPD